MTITGGFGITIDLERGTSRRWAMGRDGVKRWADSGQELTQELLNSMMREPGESKRLAAPSLPACPQCGEPYCGDGVQLCIECAALNAARAALGDKTPNARGNAPDTARTEGPEAR